MKKNISVLILAAGKGKRMKSKKPKILFEIANKPMILHIVDRCLDIGIKNISVVLNKESELIKNILPKKINIITQNEQLGTAHAILAAEKRYKNLKGNILVLYGDVPLTNKSTLIKLIKQAETGIPHILAFNSKNPKGYGRLITNKKEIIKVVEEKNASREEKKINLCNSMLSTHS